MIEARGDRHHGIDYTKPNLDTLGLFYICFAGVYTIVILTLLAALFQLRNTHAVRIRNFWVICSTVLFLHVYLLLILLVYPLNGLFTCGWEFWIMGILLPFGMALFQAGNVRLLSYATDQKDVAGYKFMTIQPRCWTWKNPRPLKWFKQTSTEKRTYAMIGLCMVAQVAVIACLYFGSRKFHQSCGFFAEYVSAAECRRGTEWIPSVFWQFLWSTVFGPFILIRIKDIRDTHYWAWQTRLSVFACLPGTPLWLLFVYAPGETLGLINRWFPPSGWFLPGLITIQFVSIFFPLLDVHNAKQLEKEHGCNRPQFRNALASGEKAKNPYSMDGLDMRLLRDPNSLLYWAYTKEFTAENIMFLIQVQNFKKKWAHVAKHTDNMSPLQLRDRYEDAALIFFTLVNPHTARMNINIDYRTYHELDETFKDCSYEAFSDTSSSYSKGSSTYTENIVTPWADMDPPLSKPAQALTYRPASSTSRQSNDSKIHTESEVDKLYQIPVTEISTKENAEAEDALIPPSFSPEVFDRAYDSVKNDVYLNTWVRYETKYGPHSLSWRPRATSFASRV